MSEIRGHYFWNIGFGFFLPQSPVTCSCLSVSPCIHPNLTFYPPSFSENSEICPDDTQRIKANPDEVRSSFQSLSADVATVRCASAYLRAALRSASLALVLTSFSILYCPLSSLLPWFPCCQDNCQVFYIHNLPSSVTQNMLRKRFQVFGKAEDCKVIICNE